MSRLQRICGGLLAVLVLAWLAPAHAEDSFGKRVGNVAAGDVKPADAYDLPFLTWGGDVATFLANGGAKMTNPGTLIAKQGLKFNLVPGDDFLGQVKNYLEGKTPYLRGTVSQMGQASEVLGKDPRTKPVVFLQLTWSAGDHMVVRPTIKVANDLKGKKIALQWGGPHVGMFDDVLRSAGVKWSDVQVVWTEDVTGAKGPGELFRKDPKLDGCFVISPDMIDLTGGLEKTGDGSEKTVKGARVLVSTVNMSRSIADVYAVRKDYFDKNKETIEKLTAAYLKGCEELVEMRNNHDAKDKKNKELDDKYKALLKTTQDIYTKEVIPDLDAAHGLVLDATFVGLPGNYTFFKDDKNPTGFQNRQKAAVTMAVDQGYAMAGFDLTSADLDYDKIKKLGDLKTELKPAVTPPTVIKPVKVEDFKDDDTIVFFTVRFAENEKNFNKDEYKADFQKAIEAAKLYGNAIVAVRGHVDPTKTLRQFVDAGVKNGALKKVAVGEYILAKGATPLKLADTKKVLELIKTPDFTDKDPELNPAVTMGVAQTLSDQRAAEVRKAVLEIAGVNGVKLDSEQFKSEGVGIAEPVIAVPKNAEQAALNRRVEFRILKISPEKLSKKDFDF